MRRDTPSRKYSIGGDGLKGHAGVMWVNQERGIIEDIEIPIADNPDWEDFKFRFISSAHMDSRGWSELMETEVKSLKSK